ncbi:MAG: hypothetical protein H6577_16500 [Lewinellaceae bacterium]|nr:hypothetical protein [Saprospiraceae bacterium]MCB9339725.1 hypothetical protein [Lewinellaceae bacterium]
MQTPVSLQPYRLDRTAFWAGKIEEQSERDAAFWQEKSVDERLAAAHYLNSVVYGFDPLNPPRMDKTKFKMGKLEDYQ